MCVIEKDGLCCGYIKKVEVAGRLLEETGHGRRERKIEIIERPFRSRRETTEVGKRRRTEKI